MIRYLIKPIGTLFLLSLLFASSAMAASSATTKAKITAQQFTAADYKVGKIQHIVLFRYKKNISQKQRQQVLQKFLQLKKTAKRNGKPYILSLEAGAMNESLEGAGQGFDQAYIVEFRSEGDRNYYVGTPAVTDPAFYDPEHEKFKTFVGPLLDVNGALVFDFAVKQ